VYIYIYMYIYMYIYIYIYVYMHIHICIFVYAYINMYIYKHIYIHICICIYTYKNIHMRAAGLFWRLSRCLWKGARVFQGAIWIQGYCCGLIMCGAYKLGMFVCVCVWKRDMERETEREVHGFVLGRDRYSKQVKKERESVCVLVRERARECK